MHPLRRVGPKGSGRFERLSWDEALDVVAREFTDKASQYGAETVWPYYYAGTMGLVQRDGINRLRHAMRYSRWFSTICITLSQCRPRSHRSHPRPVSEFPRCATVTHRIPS